MPPKKNPKPEIVPEPKAATPEPIATPETPATESNAPKTWAASGPLWYRTVSLSERNDGPRMRLGRDNKFLQMAIHFDEKPTDETRTKLRAEGFKFRGAEGVWTRQLDPDRKATGQQDAEKLFDELAKIERRDRQIGEEVGAIRH